MQSQQDDEFTKMREQMKIDATKRMALRRDPLDGVTTTSQELKALVREFSSSTGPTRAARVAARALGLTTEQLAVMSMPEYKKALEQKLAERQGITDRKTPASVSTPAAVGPSQVGSNAGNTSTRNACPAQVQVETSRSRRESDSVVRV